MAARKILTDVGIRALIAEAKKSGRKVWKSDGHIPRSHGGLELYVSPKGLAFWSWRYTLPDGTSPRIPLGPFSVEKADGYLTLSEAREQVAQKSALYRNPESRDVRAHLEREAARAVAEKAAAEAAAVEAQRVVRAANDAAEKYTLEKLLAVYIEHLRKQEKQSAGNAENIFANHVTKAFPQLAATPANAITPRDVVTMLRTLIEAGKGRTAAKLRSFLAAAYALASKSALEADAPAAFLPFNVESNPARETGALSKFNRALERTLSDPELREYWTALQDAPDTPSRDALLLGLLLGGQRPAQLVRTAVADVDLHAKVLRLHDPKGKRAQPRVHMLPLTPPALEVVNRCLARAEKQKSAWLFSSHGKAHLRLETASQVSNDLTAALLAKPKPRRVIKGPFQLRDIRRTCETMLARMGVSKDTRAQILSHGISGIQAKHYDFHDYMPEKTAALTAWAAHLKTAPADNVAQIGTRRGRAAKAAA